MKLDDSAATDYPAQDEENTDNQDVGLNEDEEPSADAYDSESAAPLTRAYRDEVEERLSDRARWQTGNETDDPAGNETENGPDVDPNDPNLSAALTEAGAEDRKDELGMTDIEEFLDDPEAEDEESEGDEEEGGPTLEDARDGRTGDTRE
jgi:hypothetical protein